MAKLLAQTRWLFASSAVSPRGYRQALADHSQFLRLVSSRSALNAAIFATVGAAAGVASTLWLGSARATKPSTITPQVSAVSSRGAVLEEVLGVLDQRYVEPIDRQAALDRAKKALVSELDPYTRIYSPSERQALIQSAAKTTGLSLAFYRATVPPDLVVIDVQAGSPAARAGISPGEHVVAVDGVAASSFGSNHELELYLAAHKSGELRLLVEGRQGKRMVSLQMGTVASTRPVDVRLLQEGDEALIHVSVRVFARGVAAQALNEVERHLALLPQGKRVAVVLDVRSNPGGEIEEAVVLADHFLGKGLIVRLHGRGGVILRDETSKALRSDDLKTPLYVLQDRWSASASELLAAALQTHQRAQVVGEQSYGKGSVQEVRELGDGSLMRYSFARYHSPSDQPIDGIGVTPNVHVHVTRAQARAGAGDATDDPGLRAVLRLIRGQERSAGGVPSAGHGR